MIAPPVLVSLAREHLAAGRVLKLHATGHSMWPCVRDGDLVEVLPRTSPPAVGDVALVVLKDRLVLHRVVARTPHALITKGDAVAYADPPLAPGDVLGTVRRGAPGCCGRWVARLSLSGGRPLAFALQRIRHRIGRARRGLRGSLRPASRSSGPASA